MLKINSRCWDHTFSGPSSATNEECPANDLDRAITMANHGRDVLENRAGNNSRLPWRWCQGVRSRVKESL